MKTFDPAENDVIEGCVAHLVPAASPISLGEAAGCGRVAPAAFRYWRPVDTEHALEPQNMACFELGANQLVYASTPSAPQRAQHACRQEPLGTVQFRLLQNKQREVIWQLRLDASH